MLYCCIKPAQLLIFVLTGQPLDFTSNNSAEPQPPIYLLTSGTILASVSWAVGNDGNTMAPPLLTGNPASNIRLVFQVPLLT